MSRSTKRLECRPIRGLNAFCPAAAPAAGGTR